MILDFPGGEVANIMRKKLKEENERGGERQKEWRGKRERTRRECLNRKRSQ